MNPTITAADILAALDQAIIEARERAKNCEATSKHAEAEFADNVHSGLTALREYLRSQEFLDHVAAKEKKPT